MNDRTPADSPQRTASGADFSPHVFASGPVVVVEWENDEGWTVRAVSESVTQLVGCAVSEWTGTSYSQWIDDEDRARVEDAWRSFQESPGQTFTCQYRIRCREDSTVWVAEYSSLVEKDSGEAFIRGYLNDITAERRLSEQLRSTARNYRELVMRNPVPLLVHRAGRAVLVNDALRRLVRVPDELPIKGLDVMARLDAPSRAHSLERVAALQSGALEVAPFAPFSVSRFDGERLDLNVSSSLIQFEGETCTISAIWDVTDTIRAQRELAESERRARLMFETAPIAMVEQDMTSLWGHVCRLRQRVSPDELDGWLATHVAEYMDWIRATPIVQANSTALSILNLSRSELIGPINALASEETRKFCAGTLAAMYREEGHFQDWVTLPLPDGSRRRLVVSSTLPTSEEDARSVVIGFRDDTELHRRRVAIERERTLLEEVNRIAQLGTWEWDFATNQIFWSPVVYDIFGLKTEDFTGTYTDLVSRIHPDDIGAMERAIQETFEDRTARTHVTRILRPDGSVGYVRLTAQVYLDSDGDPSRAAGAIQDITRETLLNQELAASRERLKEVFNTVRTGIYEFDARDLWDSLQELREDRIDDLSHHIANSPDALDRLLHTLHLTNANRFALEHYTTDRALDMPNPIALLVADVSRPAVEAFILALWRGDESFEFEAQDRVGPTRIIDIIVSAPIPRTRRQAGMLVVSVLDITRRKQAERELAMQRERLLEASRIARLAHWNYEPDRDAVHWSDLVPAVLNSSKERFGQTFASYVERIHPDERASFEAAFNRALQHPGVHTHEHRFLGDDGVYRNILLSGRMGTLDDGSRSIFGTVQDVTVERERQRELQQAAAVFENTAEGVIITGTDGTILRINPAFTRITGFTEEEIIGKNPSILQSGRHGPEFYDEMWTSLAQTGHWQGEVWNRRKNGDVYPEWLTISGVPNERGETINYVAVFSDITHIKQAELELDYLAHHDTLTKLPNRLHFLERLRHGISRARRSGVGAAVLFIDLDRFKNINDSLGHSVGDEVLIEIAERITEQLRRGDTLARLGGDEFVILVEGVESSDDASHVAERVIEALQRSIVIAGNEFFVGGSIGIAVYPEDGSDTDALMRHADTAMYRAKERGGGTYEFYQRELSERAEYRHQLESQLHRALELEELELHYQPLMDLRVAKPCGVEALLRWKHPVRGTISPGIFIPIAEESRLIIPIGNWVLRQACKQLATWQKIGLDVGRMSINVSPLQLVEHDFIESLSKIIFETGVDPGEIELEITESDIMHISTKGRDSAHRLRDLGVHLAIDDFGTGYSSLAYLKRLPVGRLKVDRTFIRDLTIDPNDREITQAVVAMGHGLGLEVLAEGVESQEQLELLRDLGCDEVQGFLCARPMPADKCAEWFRGFESGGGGAVGCGIDNV